MDSKIELLKKILLTQQKYYGYGSDLHLAMIDIAEEIESELSKQQKPLTDDEILKIYLSSTGQVLSPQYIHCALPFVRAIEEAHGIS